MGIDLRSMGRADERRAMLLQAACFCEQSGRYSFFATAVPKYEHERNSALGYIALCIGGNSLFSASSFLGYAYQLDFVRHVKAQMGRVGGNSLAYEYDGVIMGQCLRMLADEIRYEGE